MKNMSKLQLFFFFFFSNMVRYCCFDLSSFKLTLGHGSFSSVPQKHLRDLSSRLWLIIPHYRHGDNYGTGGLAQGVCLPWKPRLSPARLFFHSQCHAKPNHLSQKGSTITFSNSCLSCFVLASREHIVC